MVQQPMDLSMVEQKLRRGDYLVPNDLISDVKLIFANAKTYNRKGSEVRGMSSADFSLGQK